jgi:exodeoxyribonuclease V alpha subunit
VPTTLTGEVERVTFENDDTSFRVVRLGSVDGLATARKIAVVGTFQAVGPGTRVRVTGEFVNDPRHGEQFRVDALVPLEPTSLASLEKYLGSGLLPGIGPGFAKRIVEMFGMETLTVLDRDPERLARVPGLGGSRAKQVGEAWSARRGLADVMLLLQTHGATPALAARICKYYGERAAAIVQRSPYRLALDVKGIGFKTADRIAQSIGIVGDHPERAQAGVVHMLGTLSEQGHVFSARPLLTERSAEMLGIGAGHVEAAIDALYAGGHVVVEDDAVYLARLYAAETAVAAGVVRLSSAAAPPLGDVEATLRRVEQRLGIELAPAQRRAIEVAASHKVCVITGGPGVGKTTIIRAVLGMLQSSRLEVRLAAPTGRAAKRMSEATSHEASTIHRLLEYDPRAGIFTKNERDTIDAQAVILDESSMIDVQLASALLAALRDSARLVIVGDADQLPSVGPGAFLRDVIASGTVPTVRLNEVFRQAQESRIVQSAHRILVGEVPASSDADEPGADFFVVQRREPADAATVIQHLVTERIPNRFGFDPRTQIQVLAPMHRGPVGTTALNELLQAALNPSGPALESRGQKLRLGDKVMQTRNDYERETFNGDVGQIAAVDVRERTIKVQFDDKLVEYADSDLDALVLAYATSIHKSQGSEYPAVVVPLLTTHFVMLSRNLLYTAVTRARRLCVLVADPRALKLAVAETRKEERCTKLAERLRALN